MVVLFVTIVEVFNSTTIYRLDVPVVLHFMFRAVMTFNAVEYFHLRTNYINLYLLSSNAD